MLRGCSTAWRRSGAADAPAARDASAGSTTRTFTGACYAPAAMIRASRSAAWALLVLLLAGVWTRAEAAQTRFDTTGHAEPVATVTVTCGMCAWSSPEASM